MSYSFTPGFTIRGFAGLTYDSKVPGVSAPVNPAAALDAGTPAGIRYSSETSYYGGGRALVKF